MKKIYLAPNTTIVRVQLQQMIAGSPAAQALSIDDIGTNAVSDENEIGARSTLWEDEE
jgi:hypothetical protein